MIKLTEENDGMEKADLLELFLLKLGLSSYESRIFMTLLTQGRLTVLEMSRSSGISRTSVYRYVDELEKQGLIQEVREGEKRYYQTIDIHNLKLLIEQRESEVKFLKQSIPQILPCFSLTEELAQPGTKVKMYKGAEGIKQMMWNSLKTRTEVLAYSFRANSEIVGKAFANKWKREFIKRRLRMRNLVDEGYSKSTDEKIVGKRAGFETRVLPRKLLHLTHQSDIYNDVTAYYTWHHQKVFGVEIHSSSITEAQKQIYEIVWRSAKRVGG